MHIILNLDIGGAQEVVRTLAKYMAKDGHKPVVCTFQDGPLRREIEQLGIPVEVLPERRRSILVPHLFLLEMLSLRRELIRLIGKYQVEVIQTHLLQSLDFLVATLHLLPHSPSIYWTVHNYNFALRKEDLPRFHWLLGPKRAVYRLLWQLLLPGVDGVIAVADEVKEAIVHQIGRPAESKIHVIRNGVDVERYRRPVNRQQIRRALGLEQDARLILVVAMFREQKGHRYLIEAAAEILPRVPDVHIILAGDGTLKEELRAQAAALQLENQIHFLGLREDIPDLLAASDYFVLPSLWEGLPMALIEAMASGLPAVATEVSGSKQVMLSGATGWLVPPGDAKALADAILEMIMQPDRAAHMARAAQQRVEEEYGAGKQVSEHIALYQEHDQAIGGWKFERDFSENI